MDPTRHLRAAAGCALLLIGLCGAGGAAPAADCAGPGRSGASECVLARDSALLQVRGGLVRGQAAADDAAAEEEDDDVAAEGDSAGAGGTVNWNGFDSVEITRQEVSGFPAEFFFRVPREQLGGTNGTHAFFPFGRMMSATFVRDMHGIGSYEYGFARWVWTRNVISAVGPHVAVGAAEKLHTFTHEGAWDTASLDRARAEQARRRESTTWVAKRLRFARSAAVNTWAGANDMSGQMVNASIDPQVMADVMAYAKEARADPSAALAARMSAVGANLTEKHRAYKDSLATDGGFPSSSSTSMNCVHLHESPAMQVTAEGFWLPLGKKLVSIRGQVVLAPLQHFSLVTGTMMATLDEEDGSVGIFIGAASLSDIVDPTLPTEAASRHQQTLFVGPADGMSRRIPPEGRLPPKAHSKSGAKMVKGLYDAFNALPADFTYLYESFDKVCPETELEGVRVELGTLDLQSVASGQASTWSQASAVRILTTMIDCGTDYLMTDRPNSHEYGPFEAMVFLHGMIEFGIGVTARGWNEIPEDMFCPASGCVARATTSTTTTTERRPWWRGWW